MTVCLSFLLSFTHTHTNNNALCVFRCLLSSLFPPPPRFALFFPLLPFPKPPPCSPRLSSPPPPSRRPSPHADRCRAGVSHATKKKRTKANQKTAAVAVERAFWGTGREMWRVGEARKTLENHQPNGQRSWMRRMDWKQRLVHLQRARRVRRRERREPQQPQQPLLLLLLSNKKVSRVLFRLTRTVLDKAL